MQILSMPGSSVAKGSTSTMEEELSEDGTAASETTDDSWDDEADGSHAAPSNASDIQDPAGVGVPVQQQPQPSSEAGSPIKAHQRAANLIKGWSKFKRTFKRDDPAGSTPNEGSVGRISRLSMQSAAAASDAVAEEEEGGDEMPRPPTRGRTPVGSRLQTYINRKLFQDLSDLVLVQEVEAHDGVIWAADFDQAGRHLATGGQDGVVRLWEVLQQRGEPQGQAGSGLRRAASGPADGHEACPLLNPTAIWEWQGHEKEVLCLAWSPTGFLITGGMDGTARLWHPSRATCLRTFQHSDWVTAVEFHPQDPTRFLSTSVDGKVRVWSVPERRELDVVDVHEMVTAAAWVPPAGGRAAVATLKGKVRYYSADEHGRLEYEAQVDVKNRRSKSAKGSKVTGLAFQPLAGNQHAGSSEGVHSTVASSLLLVTSADARLRLFDGYGLVCKLKGPSLGDARISGRWAGDRRHLLCGSEDGWAFLWDARAGSAPGEPAKDKVAACEAFYAGPGAVTVVMAAPQTSRRSPQALAHANASRASQPWMHPESQAVRASKSLLRSGGAAAHAAAQAAFDEQSFVGAIFVAANESGGLVVAENLGGPHWL
mmetsp:Transcript_924/g.2817  ORF Transcript_924/g.2817 Transcript_924/m.2817 type:complete len:597 (-) Transcript_924:1215-3005(-)